MIHEQLRVSAPVLAAIRRAPGLCGGLKAGVGTIVNRSDPMHAVFRALAARILAADLRAAARRGSLQARQDDADLDPAPKRTTVTSARSAAASIGFSSTRFNRVQKIGDAWLVDGRRREHDPRGEHRVELAGDSLVQRARGEVGRDVDEHDVELSVALKLGERVVARRTGHDVVVA